MLFSAKSSIFKSANSKTLRDIINISINAGKISKEGFKDISFSSLEEKSSHPNDILTKYDIKIQNYIIKELSNLYPEYKIISEENEHPFPNKWQKGWSWCIDPIDGTLNYSLGRKEYSISIALLKDGMPYIGVIYSPMRDEIYYAEKGKGAFLNGEKIYKRNRKSYPIVHAQMNNKENEIDKSLMTFFPYFSRIQTVGGSAALDLCFVASGQVDVQITTSIRIWDIAAGKIILEESGGEILDLTGQNLELNDKKMSIVSGYRDALNNVFEKIKL